MDTLHLQVVLASTRDGRQGPLIGQWFEQEARKHGGFEVELVDLADVNLPLFDEANHPRLGKYEHAHTQAWSAMVQRADAFVFVTPEYNHSAPPSLLNALDYLSQEWAYKPVGFVSYGGISAGTRGVQVTKQLVTALRMMPIPETVALPFFSQAIDADAGLFRATESQNSSVATMLTELRKWAAALRTMRG